MIILTCVLPDEDGPTSSVRNPSRNPPWRNASILIQCINICILVMTHDRQKNSGFSAFEYLSHPVDSMFLLFWTYSNNSKPFSHGWCWPSTIERIWVMAYIWTNVNIHKIPIRPRKLTNGNKHSSRNQPASIYQKYRVLLPKPLTCKYHARENLPLLKENQIQWESEKLS